jgi:hypothetical protein
MGEVLSANRSHWLALHRDWLLTDIRHPAITNKESGGGVLSTNKSHRLALYHYSYWFEITDIGQSMVLGVHVFQLLQLALELLNLESPALLHAAARFVVEIA